MPMSEYLLIEFLKAASGLSMWEVRRRSDIEKIFVLVKCGWKDIAALGHDT